MDNFINLKLLAHPANWLIIWTVLLFGGFAYAIAHEHLTGATAVDGATDDVDSN